MAVRQADLAISVLQSRYDELAGEWKQWADYRAYYVEAMKREAKPVATVEAVVETVLEPVPAPVAESTLGEFAAPGDIAGEVNEGAPERTRVSQETAAPVSTAVPVPAAAPASRETGASPLKPRNGVGQPQRERRLPRPRCLASQEHHSW